MDVSLCTGKPNDPMLFILKLLSSYIGTTVKRLTIYEPRDQMIHCSFILIGWGNAVYALENPMMQCYLFWNCLSSYIGTKVKPRFKEVPGDWKILFVISRVC